MLLASASACGGGDDTGGGVAATRSSEPAVDQLDGLGDIAVTMWQHSFPPLNQWTEERIAEFEEQHPNVDVALEVIPFEEFNQKVLTAVAARNAPDIFEADDYTLAQFSEAGATAPLNLSLLGFDGPDDLEAAYEPHALDLVRRDDGVLGLPYDWEAPVLTYSIPLLRQAGIDPADLDTWDATLAAAEQMTVRDGRQIRTSGLSFVHNIDSYYQLQGATWFAQNGVQVLSDDGERSAIDSSEAVEVFELWRDAVHEVRVTSPSFSASTYAEEFGQGRVAMGWMLVWANTVLAPAGYENGRDFDIRELPTFDGSSAPSASYAWNWVLNRNIDEDVAIASHALLAFLSEQGASQFEAAGLINPRRGWREEVPADLLADYEEIFAALANSRPVEPHPQYNEIWQPIVALFKEIEQDPDVDIEQRLSEVAEQVDALLES